MVARARGAEFKTILDDKDFFPAQNSNNEDIAYKALEDLCGWLDLETSEYLLNLSKGDIPEQLRNDHGGHDMTENA